MDFKDKERLNITIFNLFLFCFSQSELEPEYFFPNSTIKNPQYFFPLPTQTKKRKKEVMSCLCSSCDPQLCPILRLEFYLVRLEKLWGVVFLVTFWHKKLKVEKLQRGLLLFVKKKLLAVERLAKAKKLMCLSREKLPILFHSRIDGY